MGPCIYCGVMIYHEVIAERGYHRRCKEEADKKQQDNANRLLDYVRMIDKHNRDHEKRRIRRWKKRRINATRTSRGVVQKGVQ